MGAKPSIGAILSAAATLVLAACSGQPQAAPVAGAQTASAQTPAETPGPAGPQFAAVAGARVIVLTIIPKTGHDEATRFELHVNELDGRPVADLGPLLLEFDMITHAMGSATAEPMDAGIYVAAIPWWGMAGDWRVLVDIAQPDGMPQSAQFHLPADRLRNHAGGGAGVGRDPTEFGKAP